MTVGNDELIKLPSTWLWSKFGEIADIESRLVSPLDFPCFPHVAPDNIEKGTGRLLEFSTVAEDKVTSNKQHFFPGQILYSKIRPYLSKVVLSDFEGLCSADMYPISTILERQYLFRYMLSESFLSAVHQAAGNRVVLPKINQEQLNNVAVPVAPLPEQHRIVAKIEALQERSVRAAKALEEVGPLLEQFRQSILAAAFSGRLTADWRAKNPLSTEIGGEGQGEGERKGVEPAHELLARIRTERRQRWEQAELAKYEAKRKEPPKDWKDKYEEPEPVDETDLPELPQGWCWAKLHELSEFITSGSRGWAEFYSSTGPLFLRAQNINTDKLLLDDVARVQPPASSEGMRTRIELGDLLITITGANVAKAASVDIDLGEAYVSQHVALARLVAPDFCSFIHLWTVSAANGRAQLLEDAYGNGKPGLNLEHLRELRIAFPPTREQAEIVALITKAFRSLTRIGVCANDFHECLTQLNQSILAKAFRGELVPQDPSDEPASELLARIRREREVLGDSVQGSGRKKKAGGKSNASESARPAKRSKRSSKAASAATPDASADASPEPARPQRRSRRSSSNSEDASLVIRVLAEGGAVNIHADTSGPQVLFYTKSSGGGLLAEIEDIPEADLKPRESKRVANLSDLMEPDLALLYPNDINETYLPQLRNWYTWAAPQLPEHFENEFLEQAKSRWSEALQIEEPSASQAAIKAKRGRLFEA